MMRINLNAIYKSEPADFGEMVRDSNEELKRDLIIVMRTNDDLRKAVNERINNLKPLDELQPEIEQAISDLIQMIDADDKQRAEEQFTTPEKVQREIDNTLAKLMRKGLIEKHNDQYWITITSTVPKIITELEFQKKWGNITVPEINDISTFIKVHIRDIQGKEILNTVDVAISRAKRTYKQ
jgi:hypothetical protein